MSASVGTARHGGNDFGKPFHFPAPPLHAMKNFEYKTADIGSTGRLSHMSADIPKTNDAGPEGC